MASPGIHVSETIRSSSVGEQYHHLVHRFGVGTEEVPEETNRTNLVSHFRSPDVTDLLLVPQVGLRVPFLSLNKAA